MARARTLSPQDEKLTLSRLQTHAKMKRYIGKKGVKEIRANFKGPVLYLEAVKQEKSGLMGRLIRMDNVKGIARLARLECLGPNKWKFLIYDPQVQKSTTYPPLQEGAIEECLDAVAKVFLL